MNEKLSLLKTLVELAYADGKMVESEYDFLWAIANQVGITDKAVFNRIFEEQFDFSPPVNEFERIVQFQRMVLMMSIDEKTTNKELNFVRQMGIRLALNPIAISNALREMKNYPNNMLPPEKLMQIFQTYHN